MNRSVTEYLKNWKKRSGRKPLVIRGARQVGKTYLVRMFASDFFENIVEINFEQNPDHAVFFRSNQPKKIIQLIELQYNASIKAGISLLFLDEIQAAPEILASLRYFYEEMPELHIIAAGSLLEFALEEPVFSMPVGRIEYLYLGPMQFEEFLLALGEEKLAAFLGSFSINDTIAGPLHNRLNDLFRVYLVTGGMPESIAVYQKNQSWEECEAVKSSLLTTYQDDFNKYGRKVPNKRLQIVFRKIPHIVATKFKYVNISRDDRAAWISKALDLLCFARVAFRVYHSSCTGTPLGATINFKKFKLLFLDVGVMSTLCGLNLLDFELAEDILVVNSGAICEQFIGQHLLFSQQFFKEPELYYWIREKRGSAAEIDYVVSEGQHIVPIEVKAGKTGTLRSLHLFLREKKYPLALRFNSAAPAIHKEKSTAIDGTDISYRILSLPLYLVGQTRRLIRELTAKY